MSPDKPQPPGPRLSDWYHKRVRVTASYHPGFGTVGRVIAINKRMRRLTLRSGLKNLTAYPTEVELAEERVMADSKLLGGECQ